MQMPDNSTNTAKQVKPSQFSLSPKQVEQYHEQGYLGPFRVLPEGEALVLRDRIEAEVLTTDGIVPKSRVTARHMDQRCVHDMVTRAEILDRMASIFGSDLLLWAVYFWFKKPDGKAIPWHQDGNYWPLEPMLNISAWIALDHVTPENGCVQIIPGSHKSVIGHVPSRGDTDFAQEADPQQVDPSKAVEMPLQPGEFFLFSERTLHASNANTSSATRYGLSMRVTIPIVRVSPVPPLWEGHECLLVRGEDKMGFNRIGSPQK